MDVSAGHKKPSQTFLPRKYLECRGLRMHFREIHIGLVSKSNTSIKGWDGGQRFNKLKLPHI